MHIFHVHLMLQLTGICEHLMHAVFPSMEVFIGAIGVRTADIANRHAGSSTNLLIRLVTGTVKLSILAVWYARSASAD